MKVYFEVTILMMIFIVISFIWYLVMMKIKQYFWRKHSPSHIFQKEIGSFISSNRFSKMDERYIDWNEFRRSISMNRELKFRAWLKKSKEMREVSDISFRKSDVFPISIIDCGHKNCEMCIDDYSLDDVELMLFTGLTDKNGKEIYEGDIVKIVHPFRGRTHIGEVIWEDYRFNIVEFYFTHFDYPSEAFSEGTEYIEVIGNIFENKDLLEVQRSETV